MQYLNGILLADPQLYVREMKQMTSERFNKSFTDTAVRRAVRKLSFINALASGTRVAL